MHVPLVVLGGGPGGYAAAFRAADGGMPVALIDPEPRLGGTCLLRGCIPSKSLLHVAQVIGEAASLDELGVDLTLNGIDLDRLRAHQQQLIERLSKGLAQLAKRRKVTRIVARGRFLNSNTLQLEGDDPSIPEGKQVTFDHCIVATGSTVSMPPSWRELDSARVWTSRDALELPEIPQSLLVIGGGYIGLELATAFARFGSRVSVVELTEQLLPLVDKDLVKPVQKAMDRMCGGGVHLQTEVLRLSPTDSHVEVELRTTGGETRTESFSHVLVSIGRRPNTSNMGLEATGARIDGRGFVQHNDELRTDDPCILVIGDAAGEPMLAHKATHEGRVAAEVLLGEPASCDARAIPAVVFTDPEVAIAGLTEQQARQSGIAYDVALYPWGASGRAQANRRTDGLTKWLIDPTSGRLLGSGIVGFGAGELIAEAVVAIEAGLVARDLSESVHPHPTLSETLMHAADVFFGTATEIYKPKRERSRKK